MTDTATIHSELNAAVQRLDIDGLRWLERQGVKSWSVAEVGCMGVQRVRTWRNVRYEPVTDTGAESGTVRALVMGCWNGLWKVYGGDGGDGGAVHRQWANPAMEPRLNDLIAFDPRNPDKWWLRRQATEVCWLNPVPLLNAVQDPTNYPVVRLCRTPLSWLRALGSDHEDDINPVCMVDAGSWTWRDLLDGVGSVVLDDGDHAEWMAMRLKPKPRRVTMPKLMITDVNLLEGAA